LPQFSSANHLSYRIVLYYSTKKSRHGFVVKVTVLVLYAVFRGKEMRLAGVDVVLITDSATHDVKTAIRR